LRERAERYGLSVLAYCLMTNHVHLVVVPAEQNSLSLAMRDVHTAYAMWLHRRHDGDGHLWQGRFYSYVMDEPHLWAAIRYTERNPVRAGLVARAEDYWWSSAAGHCERRRDPNLSADGLPPGLVTDWSEWLRNEDEQSADRIRRQTRSGRPCGDEAFVRQLEASLGPAGR